MLKITVRHLPLFLFCCAGHLWSFSYPECVWVSCGHSFSDAYGLVQCSSCCMEKSWKAAPGRVQNVTLAWEQCWICCMELTSHCLLCQFKQSKYPWFILLLWRHFCPVLCVLWCQSYVPFTVAFCICLWNALLSLFLCLLCFISCCCSGLLHSVEWCTLIFATVWRDLGAPLEHQLCELPS